MIIVKIVGGLGNQMFCYAYAKSLKLKGYDVKIDKLGYNDYKLRDYQLDKYNIDLPISTNEENNEITKKTFLPKVLKKIGIDYSKKKREKNIFFDKNLLKVNDDSYVVGYFQSENYFKNFREILLKQFTIKFALSDYANNIKKKILKSKQSISIHVRRGDYIKNKNKDVHGICDFKYYKNSMSYLESKLENPKYFIFSDDIKWCKNNFTSKDVTFVENNNKRIPHEDLYLMSLCKNNIIANSTFSWWGAWLNKNQNKIVIAPKSWLIKKSDNKLSRHLIPYSWIRI